MYHIRLIKGMSYSGAVTATRRHPDVFTENEAEYTSAMKSGYFEDLTGADEKAGPGKENPGEEDVKEPGKENPGEEDTFSDRNPIHPPHSRAHTRFPWPNQWRFPRPRPE